MAKRIQKQPLNSWSKPSARKQLKIYEDDVSSSEDEARTPLNSPAIQRKKLATRIEKLNFVAGLKKSQKKKEEEATKFVEMSDGEEIVFFKSGYSPLSNFYPKAPFKIGEEEYKSVSHWVEANKARFCGDDETWEKIMETPSPAYAKILGNNISSENENDWPKQMYGVTKEGIQAKVQQNDVVKKLLLKTGTRAIAEASKYNKFWTIGVNIDDAATMDRSKWNGKNMMGKLLMKIREEMLN